MSRRYDVVIHDFHGFWTSHPLRTARAIYLAWKDVSGQRLNKRQVLQVLNRPFDQTLKGALESLAAEEGMESSRVRSLAAKFKELEEKLYIKNRNLKQTIRRLSELGVQQVLLTNGVLSKVQPVILEWGLLAFLVGVHGSLTEKGRDKPKPNMDLMKEVLDPLGLGGVAPNRILLAGDYHGDISAARRNGMGAALFVPGSTQRYPRECIERALFPDHIILELSELVPVVLGYDLDFDRRHKAMLVEGLGTRAVDIWRRRG